MELYYLTISLKEQDVSIENYRLTRNCLRRYLGGFLGENITDCRYMCNR